MSRTNSGNVADERGSTRERSRDLGKTQHALEVQEWPRQDVVVTNSVQIQSRVRFDGDIAAVNQASGQVLSSNAEVALENDAILTGSVKADSLFLGDRAIVTGDGACNAKHGSGTVQGSLSMGLSLPLPIAIPELPVVQPSSQSVVLNHSEQRFIVSGQYGNVVLRNGNGGIPTRLTLGGGVYHFRNLSLANDARVECAAPCELRVSERVHVESRSFLGPKPNVAGLGSGNVQLLVHGSNAAGGPSATPAAVELANDSALHAYTFAPNGTVRLGHRLVYKGKIVARDVLIGFDIIGEGQQLPLITSHPTSIEVRETETATFSVEVEDGDLTVQWQRDGIDIPGATGISYTTPPTTADDTESRFRVVVSNEAGSVSSNEAVLTVIPCTETDTTCDDFDDDCDGALDEDVSDGNDCTIDVCQYPDGVFSTPSPSGSSCAGAPGTTGLAQCDGLGQCQSVIRITQPFGDRPFVLPTFDVAGIVTANGVSEVYVAGQPMEFDGAAFSGTIVVPTEGSQTLTATAIGVDGGVIATLDFDVVVDSTPLELVVSATAQPDRDIQQPPASGGLTGFVFELSEPVVPSSFSIGENVAVHSEATFVPPPPTPSPTAFIQSATFLEGGTVLVLSVNPSAVLPGVTYWVTLETDGLVLAGSRAVIGSDERPEESIVRVTVLEPGEHVPYVIGASPLPGAVGVSPHDEIRITFSEQMSKVEHRISVNGSTSLIDTRISLSHRLARSWQGTYRSLLRGSSRDGLLINAEYIVHVDPHGTSDASGQPLGEGITYTFNTASIRIDTPEPGIRVGSNLVLRGVVAADEPAAVTIMFLDEHNAPLFPTYAATRTHSGRQEAGTSIDEWEATVPVPADAVRVLARAGAHVDGVAVLTSPLALAPAAPTIAQEDVQSGAGTETDPYVVLRDNPLLLGEANLGDTGESKPQRGLFASTGDSGCPPEGELAWLSHAGTLSGDNYHCMRPAGAALGWAGLSPRILVSEVETGMQVAGHNTPIPDFAATSGVVSWHTRGALALVPGKTYRVDYDIQRYPDHDSHLEAPVRTDQASSPVYVRLSDDVLVVPVMSIVWVRGSSAEPDDDPLYDDIGIWAPRWKAMDSLIDYNDGYYQPELNEAGREVLRMGDELRREYPPDVIARQCYDDYGVCNVQFQHFQRFAKFAVSTVSGNEICDTGSRVFNFGIRPTDISGEQDWYLSPDHFYENQVWELLPPDEARLGRQLRPVVHNYGELIQVKSGHVLGFECGFNGVAYHGPPMVSVEAREHYGPVTGHEFGHVFLDTPHCGYPGYIDPDSRELTSSQCFQQQLLMTELAPRDCTVLTASQCDTLCSSATDDAQRFVTYSEQRPDPALRCCVTRDGGQEVMTREACAQIGGLLSEVTEASSTGSGDVPLPTGLGVGFGLCGQQHATFGPAEPSAEDPLLVDDPVEPDECCEEEGGARRRVPIGTCSGKTVTPSLCSIVR